MSVAAAAEDITATIASATRQAATTAAVRPPPVFEAQYSADGLWYRAEVQRREHDGYYRVHYPVPTAAATPGTHCEDKLDVLHCAGLSTMGQDYGKDETRAAHQLRVVADAQVEPVVAGVWGLDQLALACDDAAMAADAARCRPPRPRVPLVFEFGKRCTT